MWRVTKKGHTVDQRDNLPCPESRVQTSRCMVQGLRFCVKGFWVYQAWNVVEADIPGAEISEV